MNEPAVRIVVVEDEKQIRRFLRMTLEAEGMLVVEAETARQGLVCIESHRPDLTILDLGLPDSDGIEVIRRVRTWTTLPILVLSARGEELQKVNALDAGADDYLTKPFGNAELLARIRVHLRRHARGQVVNSVFRFGGVVIEFVERRVTFNGQDVHLTPIEYRLLTVFASNPGKILTHAQLLREVWGPGHSERGHYLRIYMGHLRQKLESDPARPKHILTETGIGYRLVSD